MPNTSGGMLLPQRLTLPIRPVNLGILSNLPATMVPLGGFVDIANYHAERAGLRRRPGIIDGAASDQVTYGPIQDAFTFYKADGSRLSAILDQKFLYLVTTTGFTGQYWTYTTGTASASGTTITGSGTLWNTAASYLRAGDVMILDADGSGDGPEEIEIDSITNDTELELVSAPVGTYGAGTDYEIRRAFGDKVDRCFNLLDEVVLTDKTRAPLYSWDGSAFGSASSDGYAARAICFAYDRIWLASTVESGSELRTRIRWSLQTDVKDFTSTPAIAGDDRWQDLPYTGGEILRLIPLGPLLVAYFETAVFIGRPTNFQGSVLPVAWEMVNTRGIGLVGAKAVWDGEDRHILVGQDDFYELTVDGGWKSLESPVAEAAIRAADVEALKGACVSVDNLNRRTVFGLPETSTRIAKIYSWEHDGKAWSYDEYPCDVLVGVWLDESQDWDSGPATTWDGGSDDSWNNPDVQGAGHRLYIGNGGVLQYVTDAEEQDEGGAISCRFETGDIDLNVPDQDKTFLKFGLRLRTRPSATVTWTIEGSTDGGDTWRTLGILTIGTGSIEGKIDFALTASALRIRGSSSSIVASYTITEMTVDVAGRGLEVPT